MSRAGKFFSSFIISFLSAGLGFIMPFLANHVPWLTPDQVMSNSLLFCVVGAAYTGGSFYNDITETTWFPSRLWAWISMGFAGFCGWALFVKYFVPL